MMMKLPINKLTTFNLHNKRVLLRADLNVPLLNGHVADDFRLRALQPTLDFLHKQQAIIFIATHIGRPKGSYNPALSTKILLPWFKEHNYKVRYQADLKAAVHHTYQSGSIILLENLRFFSGEQHTDLSFALDLAACAEYYVNDAWGTLHRNDTSLTLVADCFAKDKKTIGFLVEKELHALQKIRTSPEHPFACIIGGGKVETKLILVNHLLDHADYIMLCPALVFTFLKARKISTGKSLVNETLINEAKKILNHALQKKKQILFPKDYYCAQNPLSQNIQLFDAENFPSNEIGISIGPKTIELWKPYLMQAKTIFINAGMGFQENPKSLQGLENLMKCIAHCKAYKIVGGGDTVSTIERLNLNNQFDFISTGGGATIAYLSGQPLPGLQHVL